jgi:hypothetical protein
MMAAPASVLPSKLPASPLSWVTAKDPVLTEEPDVAVEADRGCRLLRQAVIVVPARRLPSTVKRVLIEREAGDLEIERQIETDELIQLDIQEGWINCAPGGQHVVGTAVRLISLGGQMSRPNHRDNGKAQPRRGCESPLACDDSVALIDNNRVVEAEFADRGRDAIDVPGTVAFQLSLVGLQAVDTDDFDGSGKHWRDCGRKDCVVARKRRPSHLWS